MGIVNTDSESLLIALQNMRTAISSIESTKRTLSQKYQQLGQGWSDRKYAELGDIVQESSKALNNMLGILKKGEKYVCELARSIQEYESTTFDNSSNQGQVAGGTGEASSSFGSNGGHSIFANLFNRNRNIHNALKGVEHRAIERATSPRIEQQIISSISGGDMTEGSCSSLALAYAGNRAGYVVYDFRDGQSREVFSSRSSIEQIANMDGVDSVILRGTDDSICVERLMSNMQPGREYYMPTVAHAAVVRLNNEGHYQYLELQSGIPSDNGWQPLTLSALYDRFGCEDGQRAEYSNYLIELDSLQRNTEFLNLLGYINTDENAQMRGVSGHVR